MPAPLPPGLLTLPLPVVFPLIVAFVKVSLPDAATVFGRTPVCSASSAVRRLAISHRQSRDVNVSVISEEDTIVAARIPPNRQHFRTRPVDSYVGYDVWK